MSRNDAIALFLTVLGLVFGTFLALNLPPDKLNIVAPIPISIVGAGLFLFKGQ